MSIPLSDITNTTQNNSSLQTQFNQLSTSLVSYSKQAKFTENKIYKSSINTSLQLLPNINKIKKRVIANKSSLMHRGKTLSSNSTTFLEKNKFSNLNNTESLINLRHRRTTSGDQAAKFDKKPNLNNSLSNKNKKDIAPPTVNNNKSFVLSDNIFSNLINNELIGYSKLQNFTVENHIDIKWHMRAILLDWMCEVCSEFGLKTETYQLAVNQTDRQLNKNRDIKEQELQLLGVTSLYIASKQEEIYAPNSRDFARTTDGGQTSEQIRKFEQKLLTCLEQNLTITTWIQWLNVYMSDWDNFCKCENKLSDLKFREINKQSYKMARETQQVLDTAIYSTEIQQHNPRVVSLAVIYIILQKITVLSKKFDTNQFNDMFNKYLSGGIDNTLKGLSYSNLEPCIKFMLIIHQKLQLQFNNPEVRRPYKNMNDFTIKKVFWEDLLALQCHNSNSLSLITRLYHQNAWKNITRI